MWGQRVSITLAFFKAASGMPVAESQHTLMLCSKMGLHRWGTAIAKAELQATGTAGGSLYCTRRSARIRLRDQIENEDSRSCRSTTVSSAVAARDPGRQLQHGGALALAQARNQHHLSVRKLQRIMMGHGVVRVDLSEARELLSDFLVRENANAEPRLAL